MADSRELLAPEEARALGPTLEFLRLLWAIDHHLHSRSRKMHDQVGITGQQRLVLRLVEHVPGLSAGRLAAILHLHPSTVTGLVNRLVALRLLRRERAADDSRRLSLGLTQRARAFLGTNPISAEHPVGSVLDELPADQVAVTREVLRRVAVALGDAAPIAAPRRRAPKRKPRHRRRSA
jgi:MarR family transcriptional regulator, organic hydroperoxide resistance regulator